MADALRRRALLLGAAAGLASGPAFASPKPSTIVWTFDRLDNIGGEVTHVEGAPSVIDTPLGKAVLFDGVDDALFIDRHPLAGAATFTFEALIRPDGGDFAQRWFHLASDEPVPAPATPANTRFLFELRVVGDQWYLDAFVNGPGYKQTLVFPDKLYPIGRWHHVAQTYDGQTYRAYVNGQLQGEAKIAFTPQGPGRASVGVRMNRMNYFKGAIRQARFTPHALSPEAFLKLPVGV
ncbi:MAG: LamG domain-containing protein [Caulobacter sp.]|nr:LamG domain-containing protein [Caulobacter sp.]